jgi:hypothetical protein
MIVRGMLAERLPLREHLGRAPEVCFHGFHEVLILPARDLAPVLVPRAARPERTAPTGARAVVLDGVASPADLLTGDPEWAVADCTGCVPSGRLNHRDGTQLTIQLGGIRRNKLVRVDSACGL